MIGSVHVFSDLYIDKENNKLFLEDIIEYLTETKANLTHEDHDLEVKSAILSSIYECSIHLIFVGV